MIEEFTEFIIHLKCSNDALIDLVGKVNLEDYINSSINNFEPRLQIGGTCWANTIAACYNLAMHRIYKREGGVPTFE